MKNMERHTTVVSKALLVLLLVAGAQVFAADQAGDLGPKDDGVPDGYMIIQGDIIVPVDYYDSGIQPQGAFNNDQWPDGTVPYQFDGNVNDTNRGRAIDAMAEIEDVAHVNFIARNGHSAYIHIQDSTKNSSMVGRQGGKQVVNIVSWPTRFIIVHELCHALSFWHEQSRADRDNYVIIHWGRIPGDKQHNFDKHGSADTYGSYDFDSVMHYGQCSFSTCGNCWGDLDNCRTIEVKPAWEDPWQDDIGQRNHLSETDILTLQMLYPEPGTVFVDKDYSGFFQFGTFSNPFKTFPHAAAMVGSGNTIVIQPGTYTDNEGTYSKAMTITAPLGGVILR